MVKEMHENKHTHTKIHIMLYTCANCLRVRKSGKTSTPIFCQLSVYNDRRENTHRYSSSESTKSKYRVGNGTSAQPLSNGVTQTHRGKAYKDYESFKCVNKDIAAQLGVGNRLETIATRKLLLFRL